jgi:hypothetical protein
MTDLGVMGKAFNGTEAPFDRLPLSAKGVVTDALWNLSRMNTGVFVPFAATPNTTSIQFQFTLNRSVYANWNQAGTGTSGLDLYRYDPNTMAWRWVANSLSPFNPEQVEVIDGGRSLHSGAQHASSSYHHAAPHHSDHPHPTGPPGPSTQTTAVRA